MGIQMNVIFSTGEGLFTVGTLAQPQKKSDKTTDYQDDHDFRGLDRRSSTEDVLP